MDAPDITDGSQRIAHVMLIATQNITLKVGRREALAWVTDLKTGKPSPGLTVQFYRLMRFMNDVQKVLPYGAPIQTDNDGFARFVPNEELAVNGEMIYAAVVGAGQFGLTASNWTQGIDTADFQQPAMYNDQDIALYLYTDRRLYKPGEIVYFKGTIRNRNDGVYTLSDKKLIPVDVIDPQSKVIYSKKVAVNEYGSFSDSFTVDSGAQLGEYQVIARPNKPDPKPEGVAGTMLDLIGVYTPTPTPFAVRPAREEQPNDPQFVTQITIGNYTPPEFRVNLTPEAQHVAPGDKIRVKVDTSYYFGGPVSKGVVQWEVRTDPYYFYYTGSGAYSFEDYNQDRIGQDYEDDRPQMVSNGSGKTDENGLYTIEIPAALGKSRRSLIYTIEALVWDQANMSVADRVQVVINQGQFQVGVGVDNYVGAANEKQNIRLIAVNHDSSPLPDKALDVKVVQRVWSSVQTIEPGTGRTIWENEVKEKEVVAGKVTTDASGKAAFDFTPIAGGAYKIYVSTRDGKDNLIKSSTFVWIAGSDYVAWREPNSNRIDLQADKTGYKVGDVASILIPTPFQGDSTALITIERGGILRQEVITLTGNSTIYKLPITLDMSPNAFFSVTVIKGEDQHNFTAAFRTGLIQLQVDTERLGLNIAVTPDRSKTAPREQVTYKLKVTDYAGNPVQAEVGLALVDEAVLALMPDDLPSLMAYFYSRQGLGIRTANALIYSIDQKTREIINVQKGGGKGGNDYFGIFTIRQNFITTPLWQPSVITDKNGEATVTVTLPDQLTTWVLDARAYTLPMGDAKTTLVGQTTQSIVSTRPVLIRPEVPRFYVVGDSSILSAIVNNNTDEAQEVTVTLEASGVSVKTDLVQYATIPANDRMKFDWSMVVSDQQAADLLFTVATKDGKYTDAAKPVTGQGEDRLIPILRYQTPDTVTTGGIIGSEGGIRIEGLLAPPTGAGKDDTLNIRVDRSLASATTAALKTLEIYPYYCIEQTVSRFLPDAVMYQMQRKLNIRDAVLGDELTSTLQTALQRLYADQHADGGWGWFVNDSSDQLVTAYAVLGLSEVRAAGWMVDGNAFDRAVELLRTSLKEVNEETPAWDLNRQAFILYVLARSSQIDAATRPPYYDVSRTVKLFDQRDRMNLDALAFLSMTFHSIEPQSGYHTTPLLDTLKRASEITLSGRHWQETFSDMWNWTTDTRTTAIILKALVEVEPTSPLIPDAVRWLVTARKYDAWETTQETAWSVMALSAWMQRTGDLTPDYTFGVKLNDKALATGEKATPDNVRDPFDLRLPVAEMLQDRVNRIAIERGAGKGTMYYSAQLRTFLPVEKVQAISRGLSIERKYSLATDRENKPITSAKVGERIRVTLTIIVPEALNYVAIEDPLPAGTQSINTSFQTSQRINVNNPMEYGWLYWVFTHKELRDDRTVLYAPYLPPGTYIYSYEIRAGVPGTYHVMPAHGHAFYMPEIFGRTNGQLFTLEPAAE
jgi:alpha-2-macroglobulin